MRRVADARAAVHFLRASKRIALMRMQRAARYRVEMRGKKVAAGLNKYKVKGRACGRVLRRYSTARGTQFNQFFTTPKLIWSTLGISIGPLHANN